MRMKKETLKTLVWKEGKHYVAQCLNVDVSSFGKTKPEAIKNITEAVALYFDGKKKKDFNKITTPSLIETPFVYA